MAPFSTDISSAEPKMTKPLFITLEGSEGVGKTSNMEFIKSMLNEKGIEFVDS